MEEDKKHIKEETWDGARIPFSNLIATPPQ